MGETADALRDHRLYPSWQRVPVESSTLDPTALWVLQ
jgi:hypothetical protein